MGIKIHKPGWQSMLMDLGRPMARSKGIPGSGVLDTFRYFWACGLVNSNLSSLPYSPVLEISSGNVEIEFTAGHTIAITGSAFTATLDGTEVPSYKAIKAQKNTLLRIDQIERNGTVYLAIDGIWHVARLYQSASADILTPFPGLIGRSLRKNDVINITPFKNAPIFKGETPFHIRHDFQRFQPVFRITAGPELDCLDSSAKKTLPDSTFLIHRDSNRMGYRLQTDDIRPVNPVPMLSSIVIPGIIQWPGEKDPILLLPNCQTTGGYPRIAKVIEADLWKLAYVGPGDDIRFQWTTRNEALYLKNYQQEQFIRTWKTIFPHRHPNFQPSYSENIY